MTHFCIIFLRSISAAGAAFISRGKQSEVLSVKKEENMKKVYISLIPALFLLNTSLAPTMLY